MSAPAEVMARTGRLSAGLSALFAVLSVVCASHCLATPVLLVALPGIGFLLDETVRMGTLLTAVTFSGASLGWGFRRHRRWNGFAMLGAGSILMGCGLFWAAHPWDAVSAAMGASLLTAAHIRNQRLCRGCACGRCQQTDANHA